MNEKSTVLIFLGLTLLLVGVAMFISAGDGMRQVFSGGRFIYVDDIQAQATMSFGLILSVIGIGVGVTGVIMIKPNNEQRPSTQIVDGNDIIYTMNQLQKSLSKNIIDESEFNLKRKDVIDKHLKLDSINNDPKRVQNVLVKLQNLKLNDYVNDEEFKVLKQLIIDKL